MNGIENRRSVPRYTVTWPGQVLFGDVVTSCLLQDLSVAGARICCDTYFNPSVGLTVQFDFSPFHPGSLFRLPASVVWNRGRGAEFEQGLVFTDIDDETLSRLAHILNLLSGGEDI